MIATPLLMEYLLSGRSLTTSNWSYIVFVLFPLTAPQSGARLLAFLQEVD